MRQAAPASPLAIEAGVRNIETVPAHQQA